MDCLLVADDLTGACDAAVHFAVRGLSTLVPLSPGDYTAHVIAVSTESRDRTVPEIRAALATAAAQYPVSPATRIFKKIDSTLRGNCGMEIAAATEFFGCDAAVVCPAYPKLHRIVDRGVLRVTSNPDFDPIEVAPFLGSQSGCDWQQFDPADLSAALASDARHFSMNATTDDDLDCITAAILSCNRRVLWAGSAGLAASLANSIPAGPHPPQPVREGEPVNVLFCLGSNHPVTLQQQGALLAQYPHAVLRIPRAGMNPGDIRHSIGRTPPSALVLSGGDTASLVCRALGVHSIELYDEIVPGVPRGILRGGDFDGLPVVTKSGAFGDADTLLRVADYFACPPPTPTPNPRLP